VFAPLFGERAVLLYSVTAVRFSYVYQSAIRVLPAFISRVIFMSYLRDKVESAPAQVTSPAAMAMPADYVTVMSIAAVSASVYERCVSGIEVDPAHQPPAVAGIDRL